MHEGLAISPLYRSIDVNVNTGNEKFKATEY